ncbi:FitA-like ribbon-helix-helix domain-containing protein [Azospirillum thermophilum]|uniref:Plasmid stabilization protein n=1 Tax=Azospirillum thermophilum TaxID=2202148 RepID=A0A2S2CSH1_9PROT|nr:plasmid stabilization protein [Azospirillum thermophilum]AWK87473.1 plasmid stabilization protein [Azospirillum thermophilum]
MGHLILKDLDDGLVQRLQSRAAAHGRSPEEELRAILQETLSSPVDGQSDFWNRMAARRARLSAIPFPDSTALIREDRDRRAGLIPE